MPGCEPAIKPISLDGEWSIERSRELAKVVLEAVEGVLREEPRRSEAEIDVAGISEIDACGCQLLALFLENLRRHGIAPVISRFSSDAGKSVELMGFSGVLGAGAAVEEATTS